MRYSIIIRTETNATGKSWYYPSIRKTWHFFDLPIWWKTYPLTGFSGEPFYDVWGDAVSAANDTVNSLIELDNNRKIKSISVKEITPNCYSKR